MIQRVRLKLKRQDEKAKERGKGEEISRDCLCAGVISG